MFSTAVIAVAGVLLLIATVIPGVRLYWPQHRDPVRRSDLGIALMTGALIAFAVLAVQVMIQIRSQKDANEREEQADRAGLLLVLGRSSNLSGLDLHEKDLSNAYLKGKDLSDANLEHTSMVSASLQDSTLIGADLSDATLDNARLHRADLRYADLAGARLVGAELNGANLNGATLTPDVNLSQADLSNASAGADLRGADLRDTTLVGARLASANLQGAKLTGANLEFADLRGADLRGVNLLHIDNLETVKDFSRAKYNGSTRWPPTFYWPPDENIRPRCRKSVCTLKESPPVTPNRLVRIGQTLEKSVDDGEKSVDDGDCLPGWLVEDRPGGIVEAYPPGHRASFFIFTRDLRRTPVKDWAEQSAPKKRKPISPITAEGAAKRVFAVRGTDVDEHGQPRESVHVWFFRGRGHGFHVWAESSPALFSLFERDFITLFGAVGVEGNLFPSLRDGKDTCRS